jgi:hypothetical protein
MVPVVVYLNNKQLKEVFEWDEDLWVERPEDWYALMSESLKYKRVRVIDRTANIICTTIKNIPFFRYCIKVLLIVMPMPRMHNSTVRCSPCGVD